MTVTVKEKKDFIRWFLKYNEMSRRESVWILNYMLSHDKLLENVHFVEEARYCPKALIMSTTDMNDVPKFHYYRGGIASADAEKAFHDMRLNPEEPLYIQLNFMATRTVEYLSVLEVNEYLPIQTSYQDNKVAEAIIEELMRQQALANLEKQIDEALDQGDKERFLELTNNISKVLN